MAGTAEFSSASSAGFKLQGRGAVFSSICAIREEEIRITAGSMFLSVW
jgi:hypothetical protein